MLEVRLEDLESARIGRESGLEVEGELRAWEPTLQAHHQALLERAEDPGAMLGWIRVPEPPGGSTRPSPPAKSPSTSSTTPTPCPSGGSSVGSSPRAPWWWR